jgi:hypothetical protein
MADIFKVKRNIQRMIDQQAPEADIDAYVASEGVSLDELQNAPKATDRPSNWDASQQAGDWLTMGIGPKINAAGIGAIDSAINYAGGGDFNYSENYNRALAKQRGEQDQWQAEHPVQNAVASGIGALASAGKAPVQAGVNMLRTGIGMGAVGGAAQDANSLEERAANTVEGAGIGVAAPYVAKGIGWTWGAVKEQLANRGVDAQSINKILAELTGSGMTPDQAGQKLQSLGPEGMLADVNPGMQAMTGGTAISDPGAANTITTALANRRAGGNVRAKGALDQAFGPAQDPFTVKQGTSAAKAAVSPEYETAINSAPRIADQTKGDLRVRFSGLADSMAPGNRRIVSGVQRQFYDAIDHADPRVAAARLLDLRKSLDAQIVRDPRAFDMLSSADKASQRPLKEIRTIVDDALKENIPGFREADAKFAEPARAQAAYEEGRTKVLRGGANTMTPAELRHNYSRASSQENAMRGQGIRSELERQLSNERQNAGVTVDRTLNRDFNREKVGIQIGPSKAQGIAKALANEKTFLETSNIAEIGRGSRTAPLSETARRVWGRGEGAGVLGDMAAATGTVGAFAGPGAGMAAGGAVGVRSMIQRVADKLTKPAEEVIQKTAANLTATGTARDRIVQALIDTTASIPIRQQTRSNIERLARALITGQSANAAGAAGR